MQSKYFFDVVKFWKDLLLKLPDSCSSLFRSSVIKTRQPSSSTESFWIDRLFFARDFFWILEHLDTNEGSAYYSKVTRTELFWVASLSLQPTVLAVLSTWVFATQSLPRSPCEGHSFHLWKLAVPPFCAVPSLILLWRQYQVVQETTCRKKAKSRFVIKLFTKCI